jgi:hypothetical protein
VSGDDRSWVDREKKSFAELDRQRRDGRGDAERRPRGKVAEDRAAAAAKQNLKAADAVFSGGRKTAVGRLAAAMRDALGTDGLAEACRAYHETAGLPSEAPLISLFLDSGDRSVILLGLQALAAARESGSIAKTGSLRSQLRILADDSDDEIAEGAEGLLAAL